MRRLWLLSVLSLACATTPANKNKLEQLREAVDGYNHAFQWKNYERASLFIPNSKRTAFMSAYEDDTASLQVEEVAVRNVDLVSPTTAKITVRVSYLLLPSVTIEHKTMVQHWAEVEGAWRLEHEDNSIRELDPTKEPRDPRARTKIPEPLGFGTEVEAELPHDPPAEE